MQMHDIAEACRWLRKHVKGTLRTDSRLVQPGDAFIAWPGAATDGRAFVDAALAAGAATCLVEHDGLERFAFHAGPIASFAGLKGATGAIAAEYFGHPSAQLSVLAVTGTNGKTSTAWWLAQALSALPDHCAIPCGMVGTLGVGRPPAAGRAAQPLQGEVVPTGLTTPDPVILQKNLRDFVNQGLAACAMEASSIGLEEGRMDGMQVRVAIFTNLTQDHLDYHGSMQAYGAAKRRLFGWTGLQSAVICVDDAFGRSLAAELAQGPLDVWTTSTQADAAPQARLLARNVRYEGNGICFDVCEGDLQLAMRTHLIGSYNVANLLGVLAAMRCMGVRLQDAVQACTALHAVPGRMDCLGGIQQPLVAVDYAHTPDALEQALRAVRALVQQRGGQLCCVFGCGGDRDPGKRAQMGAIAQRLADRVVVTSDNPRSESAEAIAAQIVAGMGQGAPAGVELDRAAAIARSIAQATERDVVLIAGKGHEQTQEIAGRKLPFSDLEHAAAALRVWQRQALGVAA